ncbi:General control protein [Neophaeococcomyces mojaviensis]|uniref:General control protein n=1 Tax=Neophaeococcomyces mojaviensis TaxID=3383035 RepID=A0ACC2ZTP3_9EURO|nr:General control protein [Knufia sp. JES_112]
MSVFDNIDFQGGYHDEGASLDFSLDASFGVTESPLQAHPATVSPTELWNDDAILSTSASTAFPNLATPGSEYLDSPDFSSGLNTTPMLEGVLDSELDLTSLSNMPSLFPDAQYDQYDTQLAIAPTNSFDSLSDLNVTASAPAHASPMVRQKSSPGRPPIVHDRKASLSAGIAKASQKLRKDLPDIVIDSEDDKETAKRKKNTAAARKSRQRKHETMSAMSAEISRLREIIKALGADPDLEFTT